MLEADDQLSAYNNFYLCHRTFLFTTQFACLVVSNALRHIALLMYVSRGKWRTTHSD
jgi:hypothetical protein